MKEYYVPQMTSDMGKTVMVIVRWKKTRKELHQHTMFASNKAEHPWICVYLYANASKKYQEIYQNHGRYYLRVSL